MDDQGTEIFVGIYKVYVNFFLCHAVGINKRN